MWAIGKGIFGLVIGFLWIEIWKNTPKKWLCDYGEEERELLVNKENLKGLNLLAVLILFSFSIFLPCTDLNSCFSFFLKMCFVWILLQIAVGDIYYQIIADQWIFAVALLAVFEQLLNGRVQNLLSLFLTAFFLFLFLWICASLFALYFQNMVFGFGDIKLFFSLCLYFGLGDVFWVMAWSLIFCGIGCALLLLFKVYKKDSTCAVAPYIAAACYFLLLNP